MIYTVLDVDDVQQFIGHVCLFGNCIADIDNRTTIGILASINIDKTDVTPYAKYGIENCTFYSLIEPRPELDGLLEKVKYLATLDKQMAAEYLHYLSLMERGEKENDEDL